MWERSEAPRLRAPLTDTLTRIPFTDLLNRCDGPAHGTPQHLGATHTKPGRASLESAMEQRTIAIVARVEPAAVRQPDPLHGLASSGFDESVP